ncbi:MAG: hypothetical protein L0H23_08700, partial [Luteimonas sp.]|nr:hypothetical protein [Luteimonas sp.]
MSRATLVFTAPFKASACSFLVPSRGSPACLFSVHKECLLVSLPVTGKDLLVSFPFKGKAGMGMVLIPVSAPIASGG